MKSLITRCVFLLCLMLLTSLGIPGRSASTRADSGYSLYFPVITNNLFLTWRRNGPEGGTVTALLTVPSQAGLIYAGSWGSGVYKSVDGGKSWKFANSGLANGFVYSLAIDPTNPKILFAGTYQHGVYKSVDGSATWTPASAGLNPSATVYALAINPKQPNILFAGTRGNNTSNTVYCKGSILDWGGGVFKSSDGGLTWTKVDGGQACGYVYGLAIDPVNPNLVYVATHEKGVLKSANGGKSFAYMNLGLGDFSTRSIIIDPKDHTQLFVSTWHGSAVFIWRGGEATWNTANGGDNADKTKSIVGFHVLKLAIDPSSVRNFCPLLYALTWGNGTGLARSKDCGTTWTQIGPASYGLYAYDIALEPQPSPANAYVYFGLSGKGVYESTNLGAAWTPANQGLYNISINTLVVDPQAPSTLYTGSGCCGIFKSLDNGATWNAVNGGLPGSTNLYSPVLKLAVDPVTPGVLYAGTDGKGIYKSADGGTTWQTANRGLPAVAAAVIPGNSSLVPHGLPYDAPFFEEDNPSTPSQVTPPLGTSSYPALIIVPGSTNTLYAGSGAGAFKSTNGGGNWFAAGLSGQQVFSLAIDPTKTTTLYAGTTTGVYKTTDGGATWQAVGLASSLIYDLVIDSTNTQMIYACTAGSGIYKSSDGGTTWVGFNKGLEGLQVYSLAIDPFKSGILYAGTANGLYATMRGGTQWEFSPSNLLGAYFDPLVASPSTPKVLYAGTNNGVVTGQFINIPEIIP